LALIAFIRFIQKNIVTLNQMMGRAAMGETDIYNHTPDVFLNYKLPFDSEPLEG
jgi:hypothetical protein